MFPMMSPPPMMPPPNVCLNCWRSPKHPDLQFCSRFCVGYAQGFALTHGPQLIDVPPNNIIYQTVERQFYNGWEEPYPPPMILRIFLITFPPDMWASFECYRSFIRDTRQIPLPLEDVEVKRWRSERRACRLGEPGCETLCPRPIGDCRLCTAIRTGFGFSLDYKRYAVYRGSHKGVRYGGGLYMSPESSKAYEYAENDRNGSYVKAVLMARVVLGRQEHLYREDHTKVAPAPGYDSAVSCTPGRPTETVVYHEDAARPAYLIILQ